MNEQILGMGIKALRQKKNMTQKELAKRLYLTDKTISKWERGRGFPDAKILENLALVLGVSLTELINACPVENANKCGNMAKGKLYVCPICKNIVYSVGEGAFSCCGMSLTPTDAQKGGNEHALNIAKTDGSFYVTMAHPQEKNHYILFMAYVSAGQINIMRLYPEGGAEAIFPAKGHGTIYAYCTDHGLFYEKV